MFWKNMETAVKKYYLTNTQEELDQILRSFEVYLEVCASNSKLKAQTYGLDIPYEDFLSNNYLYVWRAIEDFRKITNSSLKNVIIRRLHIAECFTFRTYSKSGFEVHDNSNNLNIWDLSINESSLISIPNIFDDMYFSMKLSDFKKENPVDFEVISYLLLGYSSSETNQLVYCVPDYDVRSRKKMQRARSAFQKFLEQDSF